MWRRSETPPRVIRATSAHCSPVSVLYVGSLSRFTFILVHFAKNWRNPPGLVVTTWRTAVLPSPPRARCPQTEILNQRTYHFQQPLFDDSAPSSAIIIHCTLIKKNPPWDQKKSFLGFFISNKSLHARQDIFLIEKSAAKSSLGSTREISPLWYAMRTSIRVAQPWVL